MLVGLGAAEPSSTTLLGPDSLTWKYFGDLRVQFFGFQRLAGTENSIEQLGQGVLDHSMAFTDPLGRGRRSAPPINKALYAEDAEQWGRTVRDFHKSIKGTISDGSRYHALNPELYYWAHATFVDEVITMTDTFIRRLSHEEKSQIFEESKVWYSRYGVSSRSQPQNYDEFVEYWNDMLTRFVPHKTILFATGYIRKGVPGPRGIPRPVWNVVAAPLNLFIRNVIVGTLPDEMKAACELPWSEAQERRFQTFAAMMRGLNPILNRLPLSILYVPWAREAFEREGVDPRKANNQSPGSR
nr:oxygenase MpaB family protein [Smaragdicoccus niigatensis]